jgi:excisionase family DNA binding protein
MNRQTKGNRREGAIRVPAFEAERADETYYYLAAALRAHEKGPHAKDPTARIHLNNIPVTPLALRRMLRVVACIKYGSDALTRPRDVMLTTQTVAMFLGVSRPSVTKLLTQEDSPLKHHMVGSHRRVRYKDLMDYMRKQSTRQSRRDRGHDDDLPPSSAET